MWHEYRAMIRKAVIVALTLGTVGRSSTRSNPATTDRHIRHVAPQQVIDGMR